MDQDPEVEYSLLNPLAQNDVFPHRDSEKYIAPYAKIQDLLYTPLQILLFMMENKLYIFLPTEICWMSGLGEAADTPTRVGATMTVRKGDRIKSILTEKIYEVKTIKDSVVVLQSLDGLNQVWTEKGNLKLFYERVASEEVLNVPLSARKRPLRSPSKVVLDFL